MKTKPKKYFSPEARERIAKAQRKRWREWRAKRKLAMRGKKSVA